MVLELELVVLELELVVLELELVVLELLEFDPSEEDWVDADELDEEPPPGGFAGEEPPPPHPTMMRSSRHSPMSPRRVRLTCTWKKLPCCSGSYSGAGQPSSRALPLARPSLHTGVRNEGH